MRSILLFTISSNVRVYAIFATGIICRRLTSGKYGRSLAEVRSKS